MSVNTNTWNRIRYTLYQPFYDLAGNYFNEYRKLSIEGLNLSPADKILIVGAGTGLDLNYLNHQKNITAIDLTSSMVADLMGKAEELHLPVEALVMDGHELEFSDSTFDVVILHLIVAVIPDPDRCLSEVRRVLKPNGRFTIMDKFIPAQGEVSFIRQLLNPFTNFLFSDITRDANALLDRAGLTIISDKVYKMGLRIILGKKGKKTQDSLLKKVRTINSTVSAFPENTAKLPLAPSTRIALMRKKSVNKTGALSRSRLKSNAEILNLNVFSRFPELETKRLVLRRFAVTDAMAYYELRSNEEAMQYMDRPLSKSKEEALEAIKKTHQNFRKKKGIWWALADKRNNKFMGYIGFKEIDKKNKSAEIGYVLHPDYWASSWMTEAVEAVLKFVFEELNLHRVIGNINPANEASRGLLKKFGFQREAYFREDYYFDGKFLDSEIYGLLASDYDPEHGYKK